MFDYAGIALCGSEMPIIELQRDPYFTRNAQSTYNLLFVIPTPEEAGMAEFEHPQLVKLKWVEQMHAKGSKVLLPVIPGPFGDYKWSMLHKQDTSQTALKGLGFNAGSDRMRWFYADEMLDRMLLTEPMVKHNHAPLTDLHQCSEYFYTTWCAEHPGRKPEINFNYLVQRRMAVDSGRSKLRACILLAEVKGVLASSTVRKP